MELLQNSLTGQRCAIALNENSATPPDFLNYKVRYYNPNKGFVEGPDAWQTILWKIHKEVDEELTTHPPPYEEIIESAEVMELISDIMGFADSFYDLNSTQEGEVNISAIIADLADYMLTPKELNVTEDHIASSGGSSNVVNFWALLFILISNMIINIIHFSLFMWQ
jgi:hypothetical protein